MIYDIVLDSRYNFRIRRSDLPDSAWVEAFPLAQRFWQTLIEQPLLNESFRDIAAQMLHYVQRDVAVKIRGL